MKDPQHKDKDSKKSPLPSSKIESSKVKSKSKSKDKGKGKGKGKGKPKPKPKTKSKTKKVKAKRRIKTRSIKDRGDSETLESESMSEDDEDASDVDEHGNIIGLIDYEFDNAVKEKRLRRPKRSRVCSRRKIKGPITRSQSLNGLNFEIDYVGTPNIMSIREPVPAPVETVDPQLAKLIMLTQLCSHVEGLKKKGKKKKNRFLDETSDEDSDSSYDGDQDEPEDIRETFTDIEEKFYKKLSKKKRRNLVEEYEALQEQSKNDVPLKFRIMNLEDTSNRSKSFLMTRLNSFQNMEPHENEFHKLNAWFSQFEKLPMGKYVKFPLNRETSSSRDIYKFLVSSRKTLDDAVYGHEHVKDEVIQLISGWISNDVGTGQVLALRGPPGNGKTTLVKNGLSKVLGRPFVLIALGGAKDSAFLQGHEYTFEGSKPGRIVEVIRDAGCMNPVIFFDEVDKISDTSSGKEISNLLCHLLDPVQNSTFHDRYFSGIDIDLSKAVFVMSFNDESKIDPILKDRMKVIKMSGFKATDKVNIAINYLLPDIFAEYNFKPKDLVVPEKTVLYIVTKFTSEQGVRELRRKLSTIVSKLNVLKLMGKKNKSKIEKVVKYKLDNPIKFPLTLTEEYVDKFLKDNVKVQINPNMYL